MTNKSNLDVAYEIVQQTAEISFTQLWNRVAEIQEYSEDQKREKVGKFYTNLLLDGRFINLGDNVWDLRERNTFDKVHIDMSECYSDDEDEDEDPEELAEEKEEEGIIDDSNDEESKDFEESEEI